MLSKSKCKIQDSKNPVNNNYVKDERQRKLRDNMPQPKKKIGTWQEHEQSKPNVLQNQPLKAYGPTEKLPAEQSPGHHHRKMPRTTIFPRQKVADVLQGKGAENDQVAVVPPKIMTKEDAARPDQVAVAPA